MSFSPSSAASITRVDTTEPLSSRMSAANVGTYSPCTVVGQVVGTAGPDIRSLRSLMRDDSVWFCYGTIAATLFSFEPYFWNQLRM
jgi:hypothetical protein